MRRHGAAAGLATLALAPALAVMAALTLTPALAVAAPTGLSGAPWFEARTRGFRVMAGDSTRAVSVAQRLERLDGLLAAVHPALPSRPGRRVAVFVFADTSEMRAYRHPLAENAEAAFVPGPEGGCLMMCGDGVGRDGSSALVHEYVHACLDAAHGNLPLWVNEGLATYLSFLRETRDSLDVGRAPPRLTGPLRAGRRVPLDRLFDVHARSAAYSGPNAALDFYVESWGLVHLLLSGTRADRERFGRFLDAVRAGTAPRAAFEREFPRERWAAMQSAVPSHLERTRPRRVPFPWVEDPSMAAAPLSAAEAALRLGGLLRAMGREREAREHFRHALADDSTRTAARAALDALTPGR